MSKKKAENKAASKTLKMLKKMFVGNRIRISHTGDLAKLCGTTTGKCKNVYYQSDGPLFESFDFEFGNGSMYRVVLNKKTKITRTSIEGEIGSTEGYRKVELV